MPTPEWPEVALEVSREGAIANTDAQLGDPDRVISLFQEARVAVLARTTIGGRHAAAVAVSDTGATIERDADGELVWTDDYAIEVLGPIARGKLERLDRERRERLEQIARARLEADKRRGA